MKRYQLIDAITKAVTDYLTNPTVYGTDAQVRINPVTFSVNLITSAEKNAEIADAVEAVETEAAADGAYTEEADDYQASQDPDFYPVRSLITVAADGSAHPFVSAVEAAAARYF